jgi:4-amino-4-deoxy-L-arabinose transferase-like glycosyltransferase
MPPGLRRFLGALDVERQLTAWAIFLFAVLVRVVVIGGSIGFYTPAAAEPAADSRIHLALVQNLLAGRGFSLQGPTAITPPLYVFFLAGVYRVFGSPAAVRVLQALLGGLACVLLYAAARRLADPTTALVAGLVMGAHPLVAYFAGLHLTENLFLVFVLLVVLQSTAVARRPAAASALWLGVLVGMAALTRAAFLFFLPLLLPWAVSQWGWRRSATYRVFALATAGAVLVILPWTLRNYMVFRAVVPIQSNSGMVFWAANNPLSGGGFVLPTSSTWTNGAPPDDGMYGWRNRSLAEQNRIYMRTAVTWISQHPGDYVRLLGLKFARLYGFARANVDTPPPKVPFTADILQGVFLATALVGCVSVVTRWREVAILFALIILTNVTTLLSGGGSRYSVPMLPALIFFASIAVTAAVSRSARVIEAAR